LPCGLVFDPAAEVLYVALNKSNQVARIDLAENRITDVLPVGIAPLGVAIHPGGNRLYVTNSGGRVPLPGDRVAVSSGARVVVDERGIASSGTVSVIDLPGFTIAGSVEVGLHPTGVQASPDGTLVAVANANSDSISLINASTLSVAASTDIPAFPQGHSGSSPTALAFNREGTRLFVTCGGNNSVVALALQDGQYQIDSSAPVDWYPVSVAVGDGAVFVANAKGVGLIGGAKSNVHSRSGTIVSIPFAAFDGSDAVARLNDPFDTYPAPAFPPEGGGLARGRARPRTRNPFGNLGVRHVFLIIKENRTYDQVLGDLRVGNGDPSLAIYGANITPNHHRLASEFVTLDNFYATGTVSADGHQWITQAMTSAYVERGYTAAWPRSYPYSGEDPLAFVSTGFLWENARRNGFTVRIFGEFTQQAMPYPHSWTEYLADAAAPQIRYSASSSSALESIREIIEPAYPTFALNVPDQFRARIFLDKFREYEANGNLPNLAILWLPSDHTAGTSPGYGTPASMVADNDLALGRIVEAISNSSYWRSSAVFVVEDDAQDGFDHVDGHRTVCLVASPYARRAVVDSTSYNQTSIVRTIEDLLGLRPMNKFDAAALPMRSVFTSTPDFAPYVASPNRVRIDAVNPSAAALKRRQRKDAAASAKMDFSHPDAAPEDILNQILWRAAKGDAKRCPRTRHATACKPQGKNGDGDGDEN
jgi:YVTN family beta-propeller protein